MGADAKRPDDDPGPGEPPPGPRAGLAANLLLAVGTVVVMLVVLELGLRLYHGGLFDFSSQLRQPANRAASAIAQYDTLLGWVPKPGVHERSAEETWSINEAGLRSSGSSLTTEQRPVVVVGDSFTFGDEVNDGETWASQLQTLLGVSVLNGGVFGYGVDQAYLRARALMDAYHPAVVLLALISDDIVRTERSYYEAWKPYFEFQNGELVLRNVPVPTGSPPVPRLGNLRKALSYSYLCSAVLRRAARRWWLYGSTQRVHDDGENVTVELLHRLAAYARSRDARFAVVALGTNGRIGGNLRIPAVVEQARRRGIDVLDLVPEIEQMPPDTLDIMFLPRGHYSPLMNRRVAQRIAAYLDQGR